MGLEIKQTLRLGQELRMTPQLQQAIKLLLLNRLELAENIQQELLENPMLEVTEDTGTPPDQPEAQPTEPTPESQSGEADSSEAENGLEEVQVTEQTKEDFDWENYLEEYSSAPARTESVGYEERELPSYENTLTRAPTLKEHLLWQLRMASLNDRQRELGELLIGNINADGYLRGELENIAERAECEECDLLDVLKVIHQFDPLGVGARSVQECLIIQATELHPANDLVHEILENHLKDLEKGQFQRVAKKCGVKLNMVAEAIQIIRFLDPKPGRCINSEEPQYITPDIYVHKIDDKYVILLNEDGLPKLKVNNFYKDSLGKDASSEAKEYVKTKLNSALWLIRSIHQRQRTIYKVTESIVKSQMEFLDRGVDYLKPMVLRDVAEDVGMHESTISRVTTNKYVHTPQGVFELKYFFNSSISKVEGGAMASEAVKERIRKIIAGENSAKPLSDQAIADILKKQNIDIARRTVAKYRELLGILPSSRRKKMLKGL
jgi:RNA polymerase sigma-54 factor